MGIITTVLIPNVTARYNLNVKANTILWSISGRGQCLYSLPARCLSSVPINKTVKMSTLALTLRKQTLSSIWNSTLCPHTEFRNHIILLYSDISMQEHTCHFHEKHNKAQFYFPHQIHFTVVMRELDLHTMTSVTNATHGYWVNNTLQLKTKQFLAGMLGLGLGLKANFLGLGLGGHGLGLGLGDFCLGLDLGPVSYTHLTLPTILRV